MNMCRFAFTMDSSDVTLEKINNVRQAAKNNGLKIEKLFPVTLVVDTKGPEIRTGQLEGVSNLSNYDLAQELIKAEQPFSQIFTSAIALNKPRVLYVSSL